MTGTSSEPHRRPPRRHSRLRRAVFHLAEVLARLAGGRALYRRRFLAPGRFRVRREGLVLPPGAEALAGTVIVQLSDLHAGPFLGPGDLADVVAAVNALEPDLVVFTGDLITHRTEEAWLLLDDLGSLRARHGVLGVFGNHDYRGRREGELAARFAERGVTFLCNEALRPLPAPREALVVLGVEDLEEARDLDLDAARASLVPGDVELVLSHNPHGAAALALPATLAVLSGHTHGRQVDLPFLRTLGPDHPGDRLRVSGPAGSTELIVSHGLGVVGLPLRVGAPPEVVRLELLAADAASAAEVPA